MRQNFSRSVRDYVLYTPADLQERHVFDRRHIHHVDGHANQYCGSVPCPNWRAMRRASKSLSLWAGMHPWGEVNGGRDIMRPTGFWPILV